MPVLGDWRGNPGRRGKVENGEGAVMAGSVLGLSQGTAGPRGTPGCVGRMNVSAQPGHEGRRRMWECGSSLRSNAPVEPWKLLQAGCRACAAKSTVLWSIVFNRMA